MKLEERNVPVTYEDGSSNEMTLKFPVKEKDRVYIVGCANSKDIVPWGDKDAEFWGVNNLYGVPIEGAHYDRWFEIHNIWEDKAKKKLVRRGSTEFRGQDVLEYMKGLNEIGCTIYMQKHWPDLVPLSIPYPLLEVMKFFVDMKISLDICRYITNTISYEIMLAIFLGFKEIGVWGVDMAVGTEYEVQKPSCEFWLGVAAGMGINVIMPPQADLLKTRFLYGFEEKLSDAWNEKLEKIRVDMKVKRRQIESRHAQDEVQIQQMIGGEQILREINKIWQNLGDDLVYTKRGTL